MSRFVLVAIVAASWLALFSTPARAQSSIAGVVKDTSGAVLPGVTIEASSPALIEGVRTSVADSQGRYHIVDLRPGLYTVTFSLPGFATLKRAGIELPTAFTATVNVELTVATIEETVTITGESPVVDTRGSVGQAVLTRAVLDVLPTGRDVFAVGQLIPGVTTSRPDVGGSEGMQQPVLQVHGSNTRDMVYQQDGMEVGGNFGVGNQTTFYYNEDAHEEISYQTSMLPAEVDLGGVQINMIPSQGGNRFYGTVFATGATSAMQSDNSSDELRARGLTARNSLDNVYDVNLSFGGPIKRQRLWFFTSFRRWAFSWFVANSFNADGSQALDPNRITNGTARLTLLANQANKLAISYSRGWKWRGGRRTNQPATFVQTEAAMVQEPQINYIAQAKWTSTLSNQLLLEAGVSVLTNSSTTGYRPETGPTDVTKFDFTRSILFNAPIYHSTSNTRVKAYSASLSYATGQHNFKTGVQLRGGPYCTFPVVLSPHDPNVLYTAGNRVFRTVDEGNSWQPISPDLSRNRVDKLQKMPGGALSSQWSSLYWVCLAQALAESRLQKGELWVGMDDSTVQLTRDGGTTWENVSPKQLPEWTTIAAIEASPHDRGTVYLAAHRYKLSDRTPYFFKTTDYGRTWQTIATGIRDEDFTRTIREDPVRPGLLYAGTDTGVYVSFDAGTSWQSLQRNLPAVSAQYMQVKNNDLVVATHGRGFWIMDNLTPLRQITPETTAAPAHLFDIAPTDRYLPVQVLSPRRPVRPGLQFARASDIVAYEDRRRPDGRVDRVFLNAGENPPNGVVIDYYLKQPTGEATLTITDGERRVIKQFSSQTQDANWMPAEKGTNRFVWDLRYPGPREIPAPAGFVGAEYGCAQAPVAPPGRYAAQLSIGGQVYQRSFEIRRDPRLAVTDDDLRAQFDLMVQIRDRLTQITDAVDRLRNARRGLEAQKPAAGREAEVGRIRERLSAIEGALTRLPGASPMVLPPKALNNRLAALTGAVMQADAKPTRPMYDVFQELSAGVADQIRQLDDVLQTLPTLSKVTMAGSPSSVVR